MSQQVLVAIGREAGSGGLDIATALAERLKISFYDKGILNQIAAENNADAEVLKHYDESPRFHFLSRTVNGFNNSPQEQVARLQFDYLTKKADAGESFVVLGRCGDEVLRNYPSLISIFILADIGFKQQRVMARDHLDEDDALALMARVDRNRKYYHNQFSRSQWGDSRGYDLCVNSGRLGIEKTTDLLEQYIRERMALLASDFI